MDRWEYAEIAYKTGFKTALHIWFWVNDKEKAIQVDSVLEALNKLGQEGWELVSTNSEGTTLTLYLKRRIENP